MRSEEAKRQRRAFTEGQAMLVTLLALGDPVDDDQPPLTPLQRQALLQQGAEIGLFRQAAEGHYVLTEAGQAHWRPYYHARIGQPYPPSELPKPVDLS